MEDLTNTCNKSATTKNKIKARIDNADSPGEKVMLELQKLSHINGDINRMTKDELYAQLAKLSMDTRGTKDVLKKRLKSHYKRQKLNMSSAVSSKNYYDYMLVIDFEATCEATNPPNFDHEIIEFPAVLLCTHNLQIVDEFHRYCRPVHKPKLTDFCTELTGITQEQVDAADVFAAVLVEFEDWIRKHELGARHRYAVVTDGPWDMSRFLLKQCELDKIPFPKFGKKWINIRKVYSNFYDFKRASLANMLENLGLVFEGRQHCGLDDARNIARITSHLLTDGATIKVNERLHAYRAATQIKSDKSSNSEGRRVQQQRRQGKNRSNSNSSNEGSLGVDPSLEDSIETLRRLKMGNS